MSQALLANGYALPHGVTDETARRAGVWRYASSGWTLPPHAGLGFDEAQARVGFTNLVVGDEPSVRRHVFGESAVWASEQLAVVREEAKGARLILQRLELTGEREDSLGEPGDAGVEVIVGLDLSVCGAPLWPAFRLPGLRGLRRLCARGTRRRPLPEEPPVGVAAAHLDGEQAAWVRRLVEPTTPDAGDMKVLPLRVEAEIVTRLDEARERLGLKTRMDLFRKSLADYLTAAGEHEVAQLFTEQA